MYYFCILYENGEYIECEHVAEASYNGDGELVTVSGEDIFTHRFPTCTDLWLRTDNGTTAVNGSGVRSIQVKKE